MKKARVMLMAIATLGIIGGAVAFKAQKFTAHTFWYPKSQVSTEACDFASTTTFLFNTTVSGTKTVYYSTASTTVPCPTFTTVNP